MSSDPTQPKQPKHIGAYTSESISRIIEKRLELERTQEWIIDTIFPAGAMHLIGGASGVGKTTWLFQLLYEWEQGLKAFGEYNSHPVPWVYVSCDRSIREMQLTLSRLDIGHWQFEAYALEELIYDRGTKKCKLPDFADDVLRRFPHAKLLVVEGLQSVMPDHSKARSQNKQELLWALEQRFVLNEKGKTVIATTHSPKLQQNASAAINPDERSGFLGSQGFIGSCSTMIKLDYGTSGEYSRLVKIMPRNHAKITLMYEQAPPAGCYVFQGIDRGDGSKPEAIETEEDKELRFMTWLQSCSPITSMEVKDRWIDTGLSIPTLNRLIAKLKSEGRLTSAPSSSDSKKGVIYTYHAQTVQ